MYFEDFETGQVLTTGRRLVAETDLDRFIELSGLDNPIFRQAQAAGPDASPTRLVPAPLQLSLAMGLAQQAGLFDRVIVVMQFEELKFLQPVRTGDALTLRAEVLDRRPTSKPDRGVVVLKYELMNQKDQPVMTGRAVYLMQRKPDE